MLAEVPADLNIARNVAGATLGEGRAPHRPHASSKHQIHHNRRGTWGGQTPDAKAMTKVAPDTRTAPDTPAAATPAPGPTAPDTPAALDTKTAPDTLKSAATAEEEEEEEGDAGAGRPRDAGATALEPRVSADQDLAAAETPPTFAAAVAEVGTPFFKAEKAAEAEAALAAGSEAEATADAAALLKQWRRQLVTAPFTAGEPLAEAADDEAAALLRLLRDGAGGRRAAVDALAALAAARLRTVHGGGDGDALLPLALRLLRRLLLEAAAEHASGETEALDGIGWTALADLIVELLAGSVGGAHEDEALRCCVGLLQPAATRAALQPALVDALVDDAPRGRAALRRLAALLRRAPLAMRSVRGAAADDGAEVLDAMLLAAAAASGDADADDKAAAGGGASGGAAAVSLALELLALVASGPGSKVADAALQAFVGGSSPCPPAAARTAAVAAAASLPCSTAPATRAAAAAAGWRRRARARAARCRRWRRACPPC